MKHLKTDNKIGLFTCELMITMARLSAANPVYCMILDAFTAQQSIQNTRLHYWQQCNDGQSPTDRLCLIQELPTHRSSSDIGYSQVDPLSADVSRGSRDGERLRFTPWTIHITHTVRHANGSECRRREPFVYLYDVEYAAAHREGSDE